MQILRRGIKMTSFNPNNYSNDELLVHWQELRNKLDYYKNEEMEVRKEIVKRLFPNKSEGTNTVELGNGYQLKYVFKQNYKIDNKNIDNVLDEIAKTGNEGSFIVERLVSWKPSLKLTEYRELDSKYKIIFDKVLTITDAAPDLEICEPKRK